jgi:hypothetical protein
VLLSLLVAERSFDRPNPSKRRAVFLQKAGRWRFLELKLKIGDKVIRKKDGTVLFVCFVGINGHFDASTSPPNTEYIRGMQSAALLEALGYLKEAGTMRTISRHQFLDRGNSNTMVKCFLEDFYENRR